MAWLDSLLKSSRLTARIQLLITQADSSWSVMSVLGATALMGLLAYAVGFYEKMGRAPEIWDRAELETFAAHCTQMTKQLSH